MIKGDAWWVSIILNNMYDLLIMIWKWAIWRQYLMCLMVSSVSFTFRRVPDTSSLICSFLFKIAIACWSWSAYISISSTSSLFISSYSLIRASSLSSYPFSFLFSSRPMKCYFLSFSSSAIMMSSWFSSLRMFAYTAEILLASSLPLLTSFWRAAALAPDSALFLSAWAWMLSKVILL